MVIRTPIIAARRVSEKSQLPDRTTTDKGENRPGRDSGFVIQISFAVRYIAAEAKFCMAVLYQF
jgi:hypothetical protein